MFQSISAIFFTIFLLSGCVSISDPVVFRKQITPPVITADIPPKKVLIMFDFSLEYPYIPSGLVFSKEDNIDKTYGNVARILVKKIINQGVQADYLFHSTPTPLTQNYSGYSHVLIEKLDKFTAVRSNYGTSSSYRQWNATLYEVQGSSLKPIFNEGYMSDGIACFSISQYANKDLCKTKYIDFLFAHLTSIGLKNDSSVSEH